MNFAKSSVAVMFVMALAGQAHAKDYAFYLAAEGAGFSKASGTLDGSGYLNVSYAGEAFTGRNANNVINAKGNKGNRMECAYEMPQDVGQGTCTLFGGKKLKMKFE